jgi:hypothetical protein
MRSAVALTVLAALLAAGPADARSPFRSLGDGVGWADGERYAAITPTNDAPAGARSRVFDDATGRTWELSPPRSGCHVFAVAQGNVLWSCYTGAPVIQELESGATRPVPGWDTYQRWLTRDRFAGPGPVDVSGFGGRWLQATMWCYHCPPALSFMDWHTGTFVSATTDLAERTVDLDNPELDVPLCAPLRRLPVKHPEGSPKYVPSEYERPWMLRNLWASGATVRVYRCGRREPLLIARCRFGDCLSRQLGGGYLTWRDGYRVYAFKLASRKRLDVGRLPASISTPAIVHTRRNVYATSGEGKVFVAPIPRR